MTENERIESALDISMWNKGWFQFHYVCLLIFLFIAGKDLFHHGFEFKVGDFSISIGIHFFNDLLPHFFTSYLGAYSQDHSDFFSRDRPRLIFVKQVEGFLQLLTAEDVHFIDSSHSPLSVVDVAAFVSI